MSSANPNPNFDTPGFVAPKSPGLPSEKTKPEYFATQPAAHYNERC